MKNLNALIKNLKAQAKSDWAIEEGMASMYIQDANDATVIRNFIIVIDIFNVDLDGANMPTASQYLSKLDTSIREDICIAIAKDKGNDFLEDNFGWSV
jgi:hypothetical protein